MRRLAAELLELLEQLELESEHVSLVLQTSTHEISIRKVPAIAIDDCSVRGRHLACCAIF